MNEQSETPTPAHGTQVKSPVKSETRRMPMSRIFVASVILLLLAVLLWHPWNQTSGATTPNAPDAGAQNAPPLSDAQVLGTAAVLMTATERAQPTASPTSAPCGAGCAATPAPVSGNAQAADTLQPGQCRLNANALVHWGGPNTPQSGNLLPMDNQRVTAVERYGNWVHVTVTGYITNTGSRANINAQDGAWLAPSQSFDCNLQGVPVYVAPRVEASPTAENMVAPNPGATPTLFNPGS